MVGCRLKIDGKPFGSDRTSVATAQLLPGEHSFVLSIPDYGDSTVRRTIGPDTRVLSLTADIGMITVLPDPSAAPPGGVAYLDGTELGPIPLIRRKVPAGEHELVVRWKNVLKPFRQTIVVPKLPAPELRVPAVAPPS